MAVPAWLSDAVLYQVYPQSFADSDGDGTGDLRGIAEHLDYLAWLGVTAVWLSPCFASPMRDTGYDVADHFTVDPRYGDNDGLAELADEARARGIRLLLDLVAGHTSDTHPSFAASADDPGDHRYIWAAAGPDGWLPEGFARSPGRRPGGYLPNFFDSQPALNFGYARRKADEPWRQDVTAEGPQANRAALRTIMDHWLRLGMSGFRADMAYSLVKDDPGFVETARLCAGPRAPGQLPAAFAFQLTFPALPAIYYGDEIGMRHLPGLPDTEGSVMRSGYNRAGARTPMQWDSGPGAGFSAAPAARLYLPTDPDPRRPTVAGQRADRDSLLHTVRDLIALRRAHPELNPSGRTHVLPDGHPELATATAVKHTGISLDQAAITAGPFSFGIFHL